MLLRFILFREMEKAYPLVFDLFQKPSEEGRLSEQGSCKAVNYT